MILRLGFVVKQYAWGSYDALPRLRGAPAGELPEAELWFGAHPEGPSPLPDGAPDETLLDRIARDPLPLLGSEVLGRFGPRLPFLVKLLAAREPLSLQAHPDERQAREGFAREEAAGIPRDARERLYRDPHHKPELLVALGAFRALAGFRAPEETARLLRDTGGEGFRPLLARLAGARPLEGALDLLLGEPQAAAAVTSTAQRVLLRGHGPFMALAPLARLYPGDPGLAVAMLLRQIELQSGEALFLPARVLHAYLEGTGVEVMASSDNVLRGGCTPKHVDREELVRVLDFAALPIAPAPAPGEAAHRYAAPVAEFSVRRLAPAGDTLPLARGPTLVLSTEGAIRVEAPGAAKGSRAELRPGEACLVPAGEGSAWLSGRGVAFAVSPGDFEPADAAPAATPAS